MVCGEPGQQPRPHGRGLGAERVEGLAGEPERVLVDETSLQAGSAEAERGPPHEVGVNEATPEVERDAEGVTSLVDVTGALVRRPTSIISSARRASSTDSTISRVCAATV